MERAYSHFFLGYTDANHVFEKGNGKCVDRAMNYPEIFRSQTNKELDIGSNIKFILPYRHSTVIIDHHIISP